MILLKKILKEKKQLVIPYIIIMLLYLTSLIFFTINIISLSGVENIIRVLLTSLFYIFFLLYLFGGALIIINKKNKTFIIISSILLLLTTLLFFGSYYINKTFNTLNKANKNKVQYTTNLVTMKNSTFENNSDTKVGMISHEDDIEGHILALKLIEVEKLNKIETVFYDDYIEMLNDLYKGYIDGTFLSGNYTVMFNNEEAYHDIENETEIKYSYSELLVNKDTILASGKELTEPFTLLIIGVDSTSDSMNSSQSFNGDTLMMVTFNPNTLSSVIFSIPRDTYVPISCRNNAQAKINSSAYGGTTCVINTIQNLTDIEIDYYVKVNFKAVVELVDALNGIELDVPIKFCEQDSNRNWGSSQLCLNKGYQTLNGEEALALARHRKTLPLSDFQRIQHQQLVVEAIGKKSSQIRSINDFYKILDAVSKNIETNMNTSQMLSFYEVGKNMVKNSLNGHDFITTEKTYLTGYSKYINGAYTFQYFKSSLQEIVDAMKVNLELKKPTLIKTFSFSGNETYEIRQYGQVYETPPVEEKKEIIKDLEKTEETKTEKKEEQVVEKKEENKEETPKEENNNDIPKDIIDIPENPVIDTEE